jgi:hypothetical protein
MCDNRVQDPREKKGRASKIAVTNFTICAFLNDNKVNNSRR